MAGEGNNWGLVNFNWISLFLARLKPALKKLLLLFNCLELPKNENQQREKLSSLALVIMAEGKLGGLLFVLWYLLQFYTRRNIHGKEDAPKKQF